MVFRPLPTQVPVVISTAKMIRVSGRYILVKQLLVASECHLSQDFHHIHSIFVFPLVAANNVKGAAAGNALAIETTKFHGLGDSLPVTTRLTNKELGCIHWPQDEASELDGLL